MEKLDNTNPDQIFGSRLKAARERLGLSQEELAHRMRWRGLDFHHSTIYKIESGRRKVGLHEGLALAREVDSTVESLTLPLIEGETVQLEHVHETAVRLLDTIGEFDEETRTYTMTRAQLEGRVKLFSQEYPLRADEVRIYEQLLHALPHSPFEGLGRFFATKEGRVFVDRVLAEQGTSIAEIDAFDAEEN